MNRGGFKDQFTPAVVYPEGEVLHIQSRRDKYIIYSVVVGSKGIGGINLCGAIVVYLYGCCTAATLIVLHLYTLNVINVAAARILSRGFLVGDLHSFLNKRVVVFRFDTA